MMVPFDDQQLNELCARFLRLDQSGMGVITLEQYACERALWPPFPAFDDDATHADSCR